MHVGRQLALVFALVAGFSAASAAAQAPETAAEEPVEQVNKVEHVEVLQATCTKPCDDTGADEEVDELEEVDVIQAVAVQTGDEPVEEIEAVEEVEPIEVVDAVVTAETGGKVEWSVGKIFGRMHPALVHLPIGFLLLLLVVEVLASFKSGEKLAACGLPMAVLAALSTLPTTISGMLRAGEMWSNAEPPELMFTHRAVMLAVSGLVLVAMILRIRLRTAPHANVRWAYLVVLFAAALLVAFGGHLGGQLVYGEQHLPF